MSSYMIILVSWWESLVASLVGVFCVIVCCSFGFGFSWSGCTRAGWWRWRILREILSLLFGSFHLLLMSLWSRYYIYKTVRLSWLVCCQFGLPLLLGLILLLFFLLCFLCEELFADTFYYCNFVSVIHHFFAGNISFGLSIFLPVLSSLI